MHSLRKTLLAATVVALVIGGGAYAASAYTHHMLVKLPDGEVAQVDYVGDVAPVVVMQPTAVAPDPFKIADFPGLGAIDQIIADMERQQAAMVQRAAQMQAQIGTSVPAHGAPNRAMSWTYVSTTSSSNGCTRTVEWRSNGTAGNGQPQVVRTSSGDCDKAVKDTPIHEASDVKPQAATPAGKTV